MKTVPQMVREIESVMKKQYNDSNLNDDLSFTVNLQKFIHSLANKSASEQEVLRETVRFIYHTFGFKEIAVPLRSPMDGKFRYEAFLGLAREVEHSYKSLSYDHAVVFDDDTYPGARLSKFTELMFAELEAYSEGEEKTYNRPSKLNETRKSANDMLEGDYYAVYLYGPSDDIFGWLELSATKDGKFPSIKTIRQLELFSTVVSLILYQWRSAPRKVGQNPRVK